MFHVDHVARSRDMLSLIKLHSIHGKAASHILCSEFRRVMAEEFRRVNIARRDEKGRMKRNGRKENRKKLYRTGTGTTITRR